MNWINNSATQRGTFAAEGENPPRSLVAETFIDAFPIGEPSPIISYEANTQTCLVFAHYLSGDIYVEAVSLATSHVFSNSVSVPSFYGFTCIRYCEANDWLFVGTESELFLFDAQNGDLLETFPSLSGVESIHETTAGDVIVSNSLIEYEVATDEYVVTELWEFPNYFLGGRVRWCPTSCGIWALRSASQMILP